MWGLSAGTGDGRGAEIALATRRIPGISDAAQVEAERRTVGRRAPAAGKPGPEMAGRVKEATDA